jgi:hypothetical protein
MSKNRNRKNKKYNHNVKREGKAKYINDAVQLANKIFADIDNYVKLAEEVKTKYDHEFLDEVINYIFNLAICHSYRIIKED